ncbi:MAG: HEAT repeat domain-containing protein [Synechococcus sp. SB0668_bin_15]|nr:HEAT repeat domain-containing protein [Synechococcus sp. SB0668_bin_15]MXZ83012.1 HEAT repeat domain-containing protein [Synechococcus sp. SB0666_bin_14]MYA90504.1 HEAT repeat domain-containing protein [Synechococcus sp. SB0663_bin_10]MYC48985.1 HEAT repeat domain-containing protein [Synechococcus sp. SB0662_bin_14]MYG46204.1 HEAT repeat domain-containing protein [Synechococcus sp. SB0675_bin_6]MYJ59663.1 HEAT repeat domain-containing protein [Synechococcus sp. SB0672_bin_6]MYK91210.1 HEAT
MALDPFFHQLRHPNPNMRSRATMALARSDDPTVVPRLMAMLSEPDVPLRRSAVKALGTVGERAVQPLTERLAGTDDLTVGSSCCKALAQVADQWAGLRFPDATLDLLCRKALEPNPVVQITAVMALGEMGEPALPRLQKILREGDVAVQVACINALAGLGLEAAQADLEAQAANETVDAYVRESATAALARCSLAKTRA